MCGIVGYIGCREASKIGLNSLKRLEYRGYDSAGIAIINGDRIQVKKDSGKIDDIERGLCLSSMKGNIAILHTRWSTHGVPSKRNAHPHLDCRGDIAIVHNGIIENYSSFKELLEMEGHKIISDTDSEILAHLIEKFYEGNLEDAVRKALVGVEGTYGLAVIHKDEEKIIVARNGSPLVIGVGDSEMFVASDVAAILEHTKNVIYLDDKEIGIITRNNVSVKNLENEKVEKEMKTITWDLEQIEKKGFKHFMLKEIFEQPESLENVLRGRVKECIACACRLPSSLQGEVKEGIKLSADIEPEKIKRIVITACGTSWHSALIGKWLIEKFTGIPVEVDYASEFRYRNPLVGKDGLLIAISQSGETADTMAAIREAKKRGAKTLGIVNVVGSTIAREVDTGIYLHAGPEIGVASTKAFTSQIAALSILALYMRQKMGLDIEKIFLDELKVIPGKVRAVLKGSRDIEELAKKFKDHRNFLFLGRGINFPVALEGALKLKEISYIHAEGYPAAEMKHGPIALIDENMPVVFIATKGSAYEKILNNMEEVKARKGEIIAIVTKVDDRIKRLADHTIKVPRTIEELMPIINAIPLQLLAYHVADMKGLDPDKPRNLAKSVTVE